VATILYLHGHGRQLVHAVELTGTAGAVRIIAPAIAHQWHAPYWRVGRAKLVATLDCLHDADFEAS
jgi:hypothetical protein